MSYSIADSGEPEYRPVTTNPDREYLKVFYNASEKTLEVVDREIDLKLAFMFDNQDLYRMSITQIKDPDYVKDYIQRLNKGNVVVSDTEWKSYLPNGFVIQINLFMTDDGWYNFLYTAKSIK